MKIDQSKRRGMLVLLLVLLLVNTVAIWGQGGWALEHLVPQMLPPELMRDVRIGYVLALALATALELTGVFLAIQADESDRKGLPSGGTRLLSYSVGIGSGLLNFSHWEGTAAKISLGLLSAISPFLWGIYSRVRRGEKIAPSRRFWHPIESLRLIREMAWEGVTTEEEMLLRRKEISSVDKEIERLTEKMQERQQEEVLRAEAFISEEMTEEVARAEVLSFVAPSLPPVLPASPSVEEISPISSPPSLRAPRSSWDAVKVIDMILLGAKDGEIKEATNVSLTSLGRLKKVTRMIKEDRSQPIDSAKEKVSPAHIDMIRRALAAH